MPSKNQHVVTHGNSWAKRSEGATRVGGIYRTQQASIDAARKTAILRGGELSIHGTNGKIREKNSYGNDPRNIKG
jgi:hypothetical protein